ncbi:MAG: hypothetical protein MRJ93_05135 [Nitrososphaeraceae archaeon]|nr:hypothetical protein [Nitrososphaeraceae archaeon]
MNISRTIPIFLIATILVFGTTISMGIPAMFAQSEYYYDDDYDLQYHEDSYTKDHKKNLKSESIQAIKCNNKNINIIGVDIPSTSNGNMVNQITGENDQTGQEDQWLGESHHGNNDINRNIVTICNNEINIVGDEGSVDEEEQNGLNVDRFYIVEGPVESPPGGPDDSAESIASCDVGDFVISGGFRVTDLDTFSNGESVQSNPTSTLDGWSASIENDALTPTIQANALCFDAQ